MPQAALHEVLAGPLSAIHGAVPKVELPGHNDRLVSDFARDVAAILADKPLFTRADVVVYGAKNRLLVMTPVLFALWVEDYLVCFREKRDKDGVRLDDELKTMRKEEAERTMEFLPVLNTLRVIERCHPVPMPWINDDGVMTLLAPGYDAQSKTLTFEGI